MWNQALFIFYKMKIDEYSFFKLCGDMYERFSFEQNPQLYIHLNQY